VNPLHHRDVELIPKNLTTDKRIRGLMVDGLAMPWLVGNELRRIFCTPVLNFLITLHGIKIRKGWRVYGMPMIQKYRGSRIEIGERVWIRSWRSSNPLAPNHPVVLATRSANAEIKIGNDVGLSGTTIVSASSIFIGNRVLIGSNSTVVDTDFHPLDWVERRMNILNGKCAPIVIEDDVFIGMNCIVLKGVRIGRGAVVGAGSVVTQNIPAGCIAASNPALMVRSLK
jgi:acetyltransferase-like isoleucine patch superfamily enzyme